MAAYELYPNITFYDELCTWLFYSTEDVFLKTAEKNIIISLTHHLIFYFTLNLLRVSNIKND